MPGQRSADRCRTGDVGVSRRAGGAGGDLEIRVGFGINAHGASMILTSPQKEIDALIAPTPLFSFHDHRHSC